MNPFKKLFGKSKAKAEAAPANAGGPPAAAAAPAAAKSVDLFTPLKLGEIGEIKNRAVMAAMTRARASEAGVVGEAVATHYADRASAGLLVTEGVHISAEAEGWWCAPGIYTEEQINAWKPVVKKVHDAGGKIVLQLWHTGRTSHSEFQPGKKKPLAPSAIAMEGQVHVKGMMDTRDPEVPTEMTQEDIDRTIKDFATAAKNAIAVGFDGVEIHGANGYLPDEFLESKSNTRTDKYGGSVEKRLTFLKELVAALVKDVPPSKIGAKFSPNGVYSGMGSPDNNEMMDAVVNYLAGQKLAYICICDGLGFGFHNLSEPYVLSRAMEIIKKVQGDNHTTALIGNVGYTLESAQKVIKNGDCDAIAFGRPFITNPDLIERWKTGTELTVEEGMGHLYGPFFDDQNQGYNTFPPATKK